MAQQQTGGTYDASPAQEVQRAIQDVHARYELMRFIAVAVDCQFKLAILESLDSD